MSGFDSGGMNPAYFPGFYQGMNQDPSTVNINLLTTDPSNLPLLGSQLSRNTGYGALNIPSLGNFGPLAGGFAQLGIQQLIAPSIMGNMFGAMPGGFAGAMDARRQWQIGMQAAQAGGADDAARLAGTINGIASTMHITLPPAIGNDIGGILSSPIGMAVMGALGPAGMDVLGAALPHAMLGYQMAQTQRGFYRGDGSFGLTGEETARVSKSFGDYFMPGGTNYDESRAKGLTLGALGSTVNQLQARGLLGRYDVDPGSPEAMNALKDEAGRLGTSVGSLNADQRKEAMDHASGTHMAERVGQYAGVISLMKEMTGDPKADPAELFKAMDTLTGGGVGRMTPAQMESQIGKIKELAKVATMSLSAISMLVQQGAAMAQQIGLNPMTGATLTVDAVLAANVASQVSSTNGKEFVGRATNEGMIFQGQMQSMSAAKSEMGMKMGAALATLNELTGGDPKKIAALVAKNPRLREIVEAGNGGDISNDTLSYYSSSRGTSRLGQDLANATGIPVQDAIANITNRQLGDYGITLNPQLAEKIGSQGQEFEADLRVAKAMQRSPTIRAELDKQGLKGEAAFAFEQSLANAISSAGTDDLARENIKQILGKGATDTEVSGLFAVIDPIARQDNFYRGLGDYNARRALNETRKDQELAKANIAGSVTVQQALRGIGARDFADRFIEAFNEAPTSGGLQAWEKAFGAIDPKGLLAPLKDAMKRLVDIGAELTAGKDPVTGKDLTDDEKRKLLAERAGINKEVMTVMGAKDQAALDKILKDPAQFSKDKDKAQADELNKLKDVAGDALKASIDGPAEAKDKGPAGNSADNPLYVKTVDDPKSDSGASGSKTVQIVDGNGKVIGNLTYLAPPGVPPSNQNVYGHPAPGHP